MSEMNTEMTTTEVVDREQVAEDLATREEPKSWTDVVFSKKGLLTIGGTVAAVFGLKKVTDSYLDKKGLKMEFHLPIEFKKKPIEEQVAAAVKQETQKVEEIIEAEVVEDKKTK